MSQDGDDRRIKALALNSLSAAQRNNPRLLAAREREDRIVKRGIPALAFVDQPLPSDILAVIHLGSGQPLQRFIVLERASFTDLILDGAMALSNAWQRDYPSDETPTVITLYRNGEYEGRSKLHEKTGTQTLTPFGVQRESMSPEILAKANAATPTQLAGYGKVRVVELK